MHFRSSLLTGCGGVRSGHRSANNISVADISNCRTRSRVSPTRLPICSSVWPRSRSSIISFRFSGKRRMALYICCFWAAWISWSSCSTSRSRGCSVCLSSIVEPSVRLNPPGTISVEHMAWTRATFSSWLSWTVDGIRMQVDCVRSVRSTRRRMWWVAYVVSRPRRASKCVRAVSASTTPSIASAMTSSGSTIRLWMYRLAWWTAQGSTDSIRRLRAATSL